MGAVLAHRTRLRELSGAALDPPLDAPITQHTTTLDNETLRDLLDLESQALSLKDIALLGAAL